MIPKKIHYCWFGGNPLPKDALRCIKSWKKFCPDYEIIQWDESNFDVNAHPFMKEAYENKAWAFVSDYARLKVIYDEGGIYLDTDVELLRNLDFLLDNPCYVGMDQFYFCATGLGFGGEKHNKIVEDMLKTYDTVTFDKDHLLSLACPKLNSLTIQNQGYEKTEEIWKNDLVTVFPPRFFDPIAPGEAKYLLCKESVSIHHYSASWESSKVRSRRKLHNFIGEGRILKLKEFLGKGKQPETAETGKKKLSEQQMLKKKPNRFHGWAIYLVLFFFLFPHEVRAFQSNLEVISKLEIWTSVLFILGYFFVNLYRHNISIKPQGIIIGFYFVYLILITILMQNGIHTGYRQLIAYPAFFVFLCLVFSEYPRWMLNALINILMVLFLAHLGTFGYFFAKRHLPEFYHVTILGHVHVIAQLGIIAVFLAMIQRRLDRRCTAKSNLLIILSLASMCSVGTAAALIIALLCAAAFVCFKKKKIKFLCYHSSVYIIGCWLLNLLVMLISSTQILPFLSMNGRCCIWEEGLCIFTESPLVGYGIDGFLIKVSWLLNEAVQGSSYAHNQILQNLLDGGVVGLILFWMMVFIAASPLRKIKNVQYLAVANMALILFMLVMIVESPTIYCFLYILLATVIYLPRITKIRNKEHTNHGTTDNL